MKLPAQTATVFCALLANLHGQDAAFRKVATAPVAESFSKALPVITGDVDGDGRLDLLIGTTDQILLFRGTGSAHVERGTPILSNKGAGNLALADFDGDGIPDVAALTDDGVLVLKGEGSGRFRPPLVLPLRGEPGLGLAAADLNQDGYVDLVAAQSNSVALFLGDGRGNFSPGGDFATGESPLAIVVGDFNEDGIPDLAVCNYLWDGISILLGAGKGAFRPASRISPGGGYGHALVAADFNGDSKMDLAYAAQDLLVLPGNGDGSFSEGTTVAEKDSAMSVAAGDLDGDGRADIVLGDYYGGTISVLLNNGDGTFRRAGRLTAFGDTFGMTLADLNGDSRLDLITTSYSGSSALIALGRGTGEFDAPVYLGVLSGVLLRRDGKKDLAVVVPSRKSVWLLRNSVEVATIIRLDDYPMDAQFGDFNGDGIPDLAVLTTPTTDPRGGPEIAGAIRVLAGRGEGFELISKIDLAGIGMLLAADDFTGDGVPDLAVARQSGDVQVFAGNGEGSFHLAATLATGAATALASADFNGDGIEDLAILAFRGYSDPPALVIYPGRRSGEWTESQRYATFASASSLRVGDFDGDAKPDLAVGSRDEVRVLINAGGGSFASAPSISRLGFWAAPLAVADFDGDGNDDIAVVAGSVNGQCYPCSGGIVLLSNGDGSFQSPLVLEITGRPVTLMAGDWDEDGKPDLALFNGEDGAVTILRNEMGSAP